MGREKNEDEACNKRLIFKRAANAALFHFLKMFYNRNIKTNEACFLRQRNKVPVVRFFH